MADNRLYIGNKFTGEWTYLTKSGVGKAIGWYDFQITNSIMKLFNSDDGQFEGEDTDLVLFTEISLNEWGKDLEIKREQNETRNH